MPIIIKYHAVRCDEILSLFPFSSAFFDSGEFRVLILPCSTVVKDANNPVGRRQSAYSTVVSVTRG